tara:strand:- start:31 stop:318 length:288 start_codon:yes stop_codon:yes gene_type:complete
MFPIVRVGDTNAAGGIAVAPRPTVLSSMVPIAAFASAVTPHPCCGVPGCSIHCVAVVTGGSATVFAEGLPVHKVMDVDSCGHPRATGDNKVLVVK